MMIPTTPARSLALAGLLALGTAASPALAQDADVRMYSSGRARIGVMVEMVPDAERDRTGARLAEVVPDGPAAEAGLASGDIITRFNGTALAGLPEVDGASGPGSKLVDLARALTPGDTVRVEYRRDGASRTATLVAEKADMSFMFRQFDDLPRRFRVTPDVAPRAFAFGDGDLAGLMHMAGGIGGLRLAELNEGLGEYFGTSRGVLLLEAPRDSTLPLRAGDVILSIGGREPKSDSHARRILGSYAAGESVEFRIMRQRREQTIRWTVPEEGHFMWRSDRAPRKMRSSERS